MAPRGKLLVVHPVHGYKMKPQEDLKTIKRNARERNRVESVNRGFDILKLHLPAAANVKKMSKVNILNHASEYIKYLHNILNPVNQPCVYPRDEVGGDKVDEVQERRATAGSESGYESFYMHSPVSTIPSPGSSKPFGTQIPSPVSTIQSPAPAIQYPSLSCTLTPTSNLQPSSFYSQGILQSVQQNSPVYSNMNSWSQNWRYSAQVNSKVGFSSGYHSHQGINSFSRSGFLSQPVSGSSSLPCSGFSSSSGLELTSPDSTVTDTPDESEDDVLDAIVDWQSV